MAQLSPRSIETLIDLVEIKISYLDITDREDRDELRALQRSLNELHLLQSQEIAATPAVHRRTAAAHKVAAHA